MFSASAPPGAEAVDADRMVGRGRHRADRAQATRGRRRSRRSRRASRRCRPAPGRRWCRASGCGAAGTGSRRRRPHRRWRRIASSAARGVRLAVRSAFSSSTRRHQGSTRKRVASRQPADRRTGATRSEGRASPRKATLRRMSPCSRAPCRHSPLLHMFDLKCNSQIAAAGCRAVNAPSAVGFDRGCGWS